MNPRIGCDPGISGALCLLDEAGQISDLVDMPTMNLSGKKQQVNAAELAKIIKLWVQDTPGITAYLERVSAMPGQGVSSMFNFGMSYGVVVGVLASRGVPVVFVSPAVWKRHCGLLGKPKDAARTLAQQLYPMAELGRKKDVGRADALLIARYGEG